MSSSRNKAAQDQQVTQQQLQPMQVNQGMDQRQFLGLLEEIKRKQAMEQQTGNQEGGLLSSPVRQADSGVFSGWRSWLG